MTDGVCVYSNGRKELDRAWQADLVLCVVWVKPVRTQVYCWWGVGKPQRVDKSMKVDRACHGKG